LKHFFGYHPRFSPRFPLALNLFTHYKRRRSTDFFLKILFVPLIAFVIAGCAATGSSLVTGQVRPPTSSELVKLYTKPPAKYDTIGIVRASSDLGGWTDQGNLDSATRELKNQAAKLGANGILLKNVGEQNETSINSYGPGNIQTTQMKAQVLAGEAIFVIQE
jgi:hypothetical protein